MPMIWTKQGAAAFGGCPLCDQWSCHVLQSVSVTLQSLQHFLYSSGMCSAIITYICIPPMDKPSQSYNYWLGGFLKDVFFGTRVQFPLKINMLLHKWAPKPIYLNRYDPKLYLLSWTSRNIVYRLMEYPPNSWCAERANYWDDLWFVSVNKFPEVQDKHIV